MKHLLAMNPIDWFLAILVITLTALGHALDVQRRERRWIEVFEKQQEIIVGLERELEEMQQKLN